MKTLFSIVAIAVTLPALLMAGAFAALFEDSGVHAGVCKRGQGR